MSAKVKKIFKILSILFVLFSKLRRSYTYHDFLYTVSYIQANLQTSKLI